MMTDLVRNLTVLKQSVDAKPKKAPIIIEIRPTTANYYEINHKVFGVNSCPCSDTIATYKVIATMSLNTPSPSMHENSLGCDLKSTIDTAATVSDEQSRAENMSSFITVILIGF